MTTPPRQATLHAKGYEPYEGERESARSRAAVIARYEIAAMWRVKWVRRLTLLALMPAVFLSVRIFVEQAAAQQGFDLALGGDYFLDLFRGQLIFVALMMAVVGGDLIAKDTTSGAWQLYFARPLGPGQYLLGKLAALLAAMAAVSLLPAVLIAVAQFLLVPSLPVADAARSTLLALAYSSLVALSGGLIILLMSAFGRRGRNVGLLWLALFILSEAVSAALYNTLVDHPAIRLVSIQRLFLESGRVLFDAPGAEPAALVILAAVTAACAIGLWARLDGLRRREA